MNLPEGISILPISKWENVHQNFTQSFLKDACFKLENPSSAATSAAQYRATTANMQWLIRNAISSKRRLRAMGSGWSLSDCAVSDGGILDTKSLRLSFALADSFVSQAYLDKGKPASGLFFAQCGMSILQISNKLETQRGRCLRACGASNGQSIAGASATGTHGAAFATGAIQEGIVGLHIVTGPDKHVWLERASYPVASELFIQWLGATPIRDDEMFNAALVSFGSFGMIHGIMLETEPIFLLEKYCSQRLPYTQQLKQAISTLDFSGISNILPVPLNTPDKELYHFEVVINPHQFEPDNAAKGVFVRTMYKIPYRTDYPHIVADDHGNTYGDDLLGFISTVLEKADALGTAIIPPLVNKMFPLAYPAGLSTTGTMGETFANTRFRGKVSSAAVAVDCADADRVMQLIVSKNKETPFPGGLAMRFVKGTQATLGFTRFEKTCVLEMDGVDTQPARDFFRNVWRELEAQQINFTEHWGKMNFNLNPELVRKMYSDARVDKWKACRNELLSAETRKVFTNNFMQRCGLDDLVAPVAPPGGNIA